MVKTLVVPLGVLALFVVLVPTGVVTRAIRVGPPQETRLFQSIALGPAADSGRSRGVAWGDMNGDGFADVFLSRWEEPLGVFRNTGSGFVRVARDFEFPAGSPLPELEGASWIDLDGDGDLDLFTVSRTAGRAFTFERTYNGQFRRRDEDPLLMSGVSASMVCWADIDSDGDLDGFVVGYRETENFFLHNHGQWSFTVVAPPPPARGHGSSRACAWGDLTEDGLPDLVVAEGQRANVLLANRGGWEFTVVRNAHLREHVAYSYGVSWADYDDDADLDLFVANFDGENILYENRGGQLVAGGGSDPIVTDVGASKGHTWGDFDLDGDLDLYVANGTPAPDMHNFYYANDGSGRFERLGAGAATADADTSAGAAAADYDLDGDLDILVGSWGSTGTRARLYENQSTGRAWITVRLVGVQSNSWGIGARVSTYAEIDGRARDQHRWILANTGYASQDHSVAHFGMGDATQVDSLVIRWPSGQRDVHRAVEVEVRGTATEGGTLTVTGERSGLRRLGAVDGIRSLTVATTLLQNFPRRLTPRWPPPTHPPP